MYVDDVDAHYQKSKSKWCRNIIRNRNDFPGKRYRCADIEGHRWMFMRKDLNKLIIMTRNVFKYIRRNRELFLELVNSLSIEQLNKIPEGFNNNIAWNFGHIVVTTQTLCYVRSGVKPDMKFLSEQNIKKVQSLKVL